MVSDFDQLFEEQTVTQRQSDYIQFRGRCKELGEAAVAEDSTLTLVRGYYFCPMWNVEEPHWWTVRPDGTIYDPSAAQFPSKGLGIYTPFDGTVSCEECGKDIAEDDAIPCGNYAVCSGSCYCRLVGV